jgi:hypothetical protein
VTDIPFRIFGPAPLNAGVGETMYTAPPGTSKFFIRDITLTNISAAANDVRIRMSIGDINDLSNRVVDQLISIGTPTFIRPLWLMDAQETLQGLQASFALVPTMAPVASGTWSSATDNTAYSTGSWTSTANTLYILAQINGVASGTTALNPTVSGKGTWTLVNQTTSTVAAATNGGVSAWWFYEGATPSANGTTTLTFGATQHSISGAIFSVANVHSGATAVPPWTSTATPVIQSAVAADTVAPGSGTSTKAVTLGTAIQSGHVFYVNGRFGTASATTTPPSGFTEARDDALADASGSSCPLQGSSNYVTTPPFTTTSTGTGAYSTSTADARVAVAFELVPAGWVNCMVSGIEVH